MREKKEVKEEVYQEERQEERGEEEENRRERRIGEGDNVCRGKNKRKRR